MSTSSARSATSEIPVICFANSRVGCTRNRIQRVKPQRDECRRYADSKQRQHECKERDAGNCLDYTEHGKRAFCEMRSALEKETERNSDHDRSDQRDC